MNAADAIASWRLCAGGIGRIRNEFEVFDVRGTSRLFRFILFIIRPT